MSEVTLGRDKIDQITAKIKHYFNQELDQDIGSLQAEMLLEFLSKEVGAHYYNQGLQDAQTLFSDKVEELSYVIQELEKPTY